MISMAHECSYRGHKEQCIGSGDSYPITKNGNLSCRRVRNAAARGSQHGDLNTLKSNGLCHYLIDECHVKKSNICD